MTSTLIINGRIIDGSGNPWFYGDLLIDGDRIARIGAPGTIDQSGADVVIDATDHVVSPGFIDIQSHSIVPIMTEGRVLSKVTQGVTTEIMGEAWTPAPFGGRITDPLSEGVRGRLGDERYEEWDALARTWTRFGDWLNEFERRGTSVNIGSFIGGGTVREWGMGLEAGDASEDAIQAMKKMVAESMEDGAFGVASALIYPPDVYMSTHELIEIMKVVAAYNGIHITHMRSEGDELEQGLTETLKIAEESGVSSEIYHLKAIGTANWPKMRNVIETINAARARGIDITADMYPYEGAGTGLAACLPPWCHADGKRQENLLNPETRARIIDDMVNQKEPWENWGLMIGPENILLAQIAHPDIHKYQGWFVADVAKDLGKDWPETICHLLATNERDIFCMYMAMSTDNLELQAKLPWITFSTDAGGVDPAWATALGLTHPRAYGTYTRVLGRFVREREWITLEDAVRKCSSAVASRLGLRDRGLLHAGQYADVIIFDAKTVTDNATYTDPHHLSTGVRDMWVNGERVLADNEHTGAMPGMQVRGPGYVAR